MSTVHGGEVTAYAAAVRAALADLPPAAREDLLEDLEQHLHEVAEEEGSLHARLGPPQVYAEELRASAGLSPGRRGWAARAPFLGLTARTRQVRDHVEAHPWGRATLEFLPELRPAWWVLRGYLAVQLLAMLLPESHLGYPVPYLLGTHLLGLVAAAAAAAFSVALARREYPLPPRQQRLLTAGNVVLAGFAVLALLLMGDRPWHAYPSADASPYPPPPGLVGPDGRYATNIFPFDANGKPLHDVFLYDQDGRPVDLGDASGWGDVQTEPRRGIDGGEVRNVFPRRQFRLDYGPDGEVMVAVPAPNVGVPKLAPQPPLPQPTLPPTVPPSSSPTRPPTVQPTRAPTTPPPATRPTG